MLLTNKHDMHKLEGFGTPDNLTWYQNSVELMLKFKLLNVEITELTKTVYIRSSLPKFSWNG